MLHVNSRLVPPVKPLPLSRHVNILKAAGETTRIRILALLAKGDLTVTDLITILGQSQPRISRHLKLLVDAGLLERYQEGAWAYFRLGDEGASGAMVRQLIDVLDENDPSLQADNDRLALVRERRAAQAAEYFAANADKWDELRSLHVDELEVEAVMLDLIGEKPFNALLDLGTGTGRIPELFGKLYEKAVGIDASRDMLSVARSNLDEAGLSRVQVRQGDLYTLPTPANSFDLVTIHQVLHFLDDPQRAIREAAKALAPSGRLMIVDFAPHEHEFLREQHAHLRLGFSDEQISEWLAQAGLVLEETRSVDTPGAQQKTQLKVRIWLASDPRLLMADAIGEDAATLVG